MYYKKKKDPCELRHEEKIRGKVLIEQTCGVWS